MRLERGDRVRYLGDAEDSQVNWGSNDDPRVYLVPGATYVLTRVEVHSWHTKFFIKDKDGIERKFNSVNFEHVSRETSFIVDGTVYTIKEVS